VETLILDGDVAGAPEAEILRLHTMAEVITGGPYPGNEAPAQAGEQP
jgi:hypothetical protein